MTLALISHPDCLLHDMGPGHPERAARLSAINDQLIASGLEFVLRHYEAPLVSDEQLLRVHSADYLAEVRDTAPSSGMVRLDDDAFMNAHTLAAARRAAGAVVFGVDLVMSGQAESAFCNVRPPGHHAERARAMGFCFFNNVAVGAAHALVAHGLKRVAIVDFDVHHGNGTQQIFQDEPRVLFCSSFQHPFYPYSGTEPTGDHIVNVPLKVGTDGEGFRSAVGDRWLPALERFRPQLILISAGFDAHHEDEMSDLHLHSSDYGWVTQAVREVAARHAGGRIVSTLEGGYALHALARSVVAHLNALIGERG
ncbi:MAG: histone deacetylase family protein [Gammaproteobacteria bacterium]